MKNYSEIAPFFLLHLLLLAATAIATVTANGQGQGEGKGESESESRQQDPLARLLMSRFSGFASQSLSSKIPRFLRKLAEDTGGNAVAQEFGPGADWSCSAEANRATDFDSCTLSEASKTMKDTGGCSWCPLGTAIGLCLRAGQAAVVNGLGSGHPMNLGCYNNDDEVIDEAPTKFWDETTKCLAHTKADCGGDHGNGDHDCTYCTVADPAMELCVSVNLWKNMLVAQTLEDFESDVSTTDQIRLDQVIHCSQEKDDKAIHNHMEDNNMMSDRCGGKLIDSVADEEECFLKEGCATVTFPGLLGATPGSRCITMQQESAIIWAIKFFRDMGWDEEMKAFE